MAIYSLHVSVISRADGHSSVAACAYRRGISLTDEFTGKKHDYSKRDTAIYNELSIPNDAPQWVKDLKSLNEQASEKAASLLWNAVEAKEPQWNSELSREYRIALPIELSALDNVELVRSFVESTFSKRGIISDWSIHFDAGNPHVHIMNSTRILEEEGFGNKIRELPKLKFLYEVRQAWENYANDTLRQKGFDVRIDRRSNKERGIELIPTKHLGKRVIDQERRGIKTERMKEMREIQAENLKRLAQNPELLTESIAHESPTFTHEKMLQTVLRYTNPHDEHNNVLSPAELANNERNYARDIKEALSGRTTAESIDKITETSTTAEPSVVSAVLNELYESEQPHYSQQEKKATFFDKILSEIMKHDSVISHENLANSLFKFNPHVDSKDFIQTLEGLKETLANHKEILTLGLGDDGRMRFTTRAMFENSKEVERITDKLMNTRHQKFSSREIKAKLNAIKQQTGKALTLDQREAVLHLTQPKAIACLVGRAGTGKSFTMEIVKDLYESKEFEVRGVALSGIAASGLNQVNIPSSTIASFKGQLEKNPTLLHEKSVLIMDEAGMTDLPSMLFVMQAVKKARAKLILLGDHGQLQPVGQGAVFRGILELSGFSMLTTIHRQKERWQKAATLRLARGEVGLAIDAYAARNGVNLKETEQAAINQLVADWKVSFDSHKNLKEQLVIAYRNKDVDLLNIQLRQVLLNSQQLAFGYTVKTEKGERYIAKGDRLLFTKNYQSLGISNGSFGTITGIDFLESGRVRSFQVQLDEHDKPITINPERIKEFDYGYAATIHKTQGITLDRTFVYVAGLWNRALTYVALTRHRLDTKIYASQSQFQTLELLKKGLARFALKDCVLDFPLAFARHHGIEPNTNGLAHHLSQKLHDVADRLSTRYQQWRDPEAYVKSQQHQKIQDAREKLRDDAILVANYADKHIEVNQQWAVLKEKVLSLDKKLEPNTKAFDSLARTLPEFTTLQTSIHARDAMAAQIHPKRDYHKIAIQLNRLDLNNLERHATAHNNRVLIENYTRSTGLAREQQAFTLSTQLRGLYTHLKAANIDTNQLNREASQYVKRNLLKDLPKDVRLEQRAAFDKVAHYLSLSQLIAKDWKTYGLTAERSREKDFEDSNPLHYVAHRHQVKSMERMSQQRDQLAYELFNGVDSQTIQTALQFHQIGEAQHWNEQPATLEDLQRAKKRLDQLAASANRYARLLTVQHYMNAIDSKDPSRLSVAQTILDNPKLYHGSIVALNADKKAQQEIWRTIRQEAKQHQWNENFKSLTHDERLIHLEVERYANAKRLHAMAWREVFEAREGKNTEALNEKQMHQLMQTPHPYTQLRNQLADKLMASPALYESALIDAGLSIDELKKQAYTNQCHDRVTTYTQAKTRQERMSIAVMLTQDPKAHWPAMRDNGIDCKQVYSDANRFERQQKFANFSPEEKQLYRATLKYRRANQAMGKLYGELKSLSWKERTAAQNKALTQAVLKRDKLANILIAQAKLFSPQDFKDYATTERLKLDKLLQQSEKYRQGLVKTQAPAANDVITQRHDGENNKRVKNNVIPFNSSTPRIDLEKLREDLNTSAEQVALHYLGEPKKRVGTQWRYGSKNGSLFVTVTGNKQGLWNDFQAGHGGDMFKLIQESTGLDFKGTLREAVNFLGGESRYQQTDLSHNQPLKQKNDRERVARIEAMETAKKQAHIDSIAKTTQPIQGTLAERYLREHRDIMQPLNSDNLRFHPSLKNWVTGDTLPALVVLARDSNQKVVGLQATFLDPLTANKAKLDDATKLSRGTIGQGSIIHHAVTDNPKPIVALAEGLETALSVASSRPDWEVRLTFGVSNFEKAAENVVKCRQDIVAQDSQHTLSNQSLMNVDTVDGDRTIIICADNDGIGSGTAKAVKITVDNLHAKGITAFVAEPEKPADMAKWDFNDALKTDGLDTVRTALNQALPNAETIESITITPEKEKQYKDRLKHYQSLRINAENSQHEKDWETLRDYSKKLSEGKFTMQFAQKMYPKVSENIKMYAREHDTIDLLPPEKIDRFKKLLKDYQTLKLAAEKSGHTQDQEKLRQYCNNLGQGKNLMRFTYKNYPNVYDNIYDRIQEYRQISHTRQKNHEQDIER